jgi:hypothetical protein
MADEDERDEHAEALHPDDVRDELPEDLDPSAVVGPYHLPDNSRRRIPGVLYLAIGIACIAVWVLRQGDDPTLVNGGTLVGGIALLLVSAYCFATGWRLELDEKDALVVATQRARFAVGHASAQLGWRGLRSRPTWRILCYSSEDPPKRRAFVLVDAIDGEVVSEIVEDNPEDWSQVVGKAGDR